MSMKILKASAGSGKTYSLTREYIRLLLGSDSPDAYRHILAVTFTNKATDEMKRRILKELYVIATTPDKSPYVNTLVPSVVSTKAELKRKADFLLTSILHDYSAFAVSTIDKFFQQTLRAFSREIGQFTSYQVELDKEALVDDAVQSVLDSLSTYNRPLLEWVIKGVKNDLEMTGRFTLDRRLKDIAMSIVSENPRDAQYAHDDLEQLRTACENVISSFSESVQNAAGNVIEVLHASGVDAADTNRGFLKSIYAYAERHNKSEMILSPTASFMDKATDPEKWFAKTKAYLLDTCAGTLAGPLQQFCDLFGARYKEYATAMTIKGQIYGLGMAEELRKAFVQAQKERGVISIEDTNSILHEIIDGTETPFLYEKLGVKYENFLLDEFQDTSGIQWDNFLPLLQNSDASGNENLVVGDVKQSIYRWRGSQWDLLDSRLQQQFHVPASEITVLDGNYRTCRAIVNFNNGFFPFAAQEIDRLVGNNPASRDSLKSIYSDVLQEIRTKENAIGCIKLRFKENAETEMDEIVTSIREAVERGASYGDIAVLVRGNAEGSAIAERLVAEAIPVISDDSLYVKSSVIVRRLISQLAIVDNPNRKDSNTVAGYLAKELNISVPEHYHCLTDLAESILSELESSTPEVFATEVPFIQAFMDWLQDWTFKNGNKLGAMLRDWEEAEPKIASPEGSKAVRIMTVHKAKGLEFPFVIFPFAEKVSLYKPSSYWCKPQLQGTALERFAGKRYRASLSDMSLNTLFKDDYVKERSLQAVDNLNILYVAMTRAKVELKVISVLPPKNVIDAVAKETEVPAKNLSHLLYAYVKQEDYQKGEPYDFTSMDRSINGPLPLEYEYACSTNDAKKRLVFRTSASKDDASPIAAPPSSEDPVAAPSEETIYEPTLF